MLNIFNRNQTYFQKLRDNSNLIESYDIDNQYNSLVDYLNNQVRPEINNLISGVLPGIIGNENSYLKNIGDGTTKWTTLDQIITDYSIPFNKLIKSDVNSVLVSNSFGDIIPVSTNEQDQLLISQINDAPKWNKLTTDNIGNRSVMGVDIVDHSIGQEHLKDEITTIVIGDGLVTGSHFADLSITAEKFLNNSIPAEKLGIVPIFGSGQHFNTYVIKKSHVKNGVITPPKIANESITHALFNRVKCITRNKFAPNTIDESYLSSFNDNYAQNNDKVTGNFTSNILADNFKITRQKLLRNTDGIINHVITSADFTPEVKAKFVQKGCIGYN